MNRRASEPTNDAALRDSGLWHDALRSLLRNKTATFGLAVLFLFGAMALLAPWIDRYPPDSQHLSDTFVGPSWAHWLGTDQLGRDQYSRLVHGARVSLAVGVLTQLFAVAVGLTVGMAAGLGGRRADALLMRTTDIAYSFPDLLLVILLVSVFGPSVTMLVLAIGLVSWPTVARLVRGKVLSLREEEFVLAARALGANRWQVAHRHLLPNVLGPVIVTATFGVPAAIFAEAALAFIGLGLPPPAATWGQLVTDSFHPIFVAPYLAISSCLAIAFTTMSFTLLGDGLRDALDPRSARRRPLVTEPPVAKRERVALPKAA